MKWAIQLITSQNFEQEKKLEGTWKSARKNVFVYLYVQNLDFQEVILFELGFLDANNPALGYFMPTIST